MRLRAQRPLGEWLGVTIYTFIGIGVNLAAVTSSNEAATMETQYWAWGFATMIGKSVLTVSFVQVSPLQLEVPSNHAYLSTPTGIYISGGSSGGFLNPVLIITLTIFRGFPWRRVPLYIFVQVLGAFCGALLAVGVYYDSIMYLDGALLPESTGVSMYTQPRDWVRPSTAFFCELLGSGVLTCTIMALGDSGNSPPGAGMHAFIIGLVVTATSMALSWPTRGCFNPARDLGPRLAALAVGYPTSSFSAGNSWWIWGGWVAPMIGGLLGALMYDLCIFKGGESPVNFSFGRWRNKALKGESNVLKKAFRSRRHTAIDKRLESGNMAAPEDMR
jgi:aquaglyceroporin related protein